MLRLRLLPLSVAVILYVTAIPVELRPASLASLYWRTDLDDILINILLYLPLGAALSRHGLLKAGFAAGSLSLTIECLQIVYVNRYPGLSDFAANIVGAVAGALIAQRSREPRRLDSVTLGRRIGAAAIATSLLLVLVMSIPGKATDFSNWDPSFSLALGNEPDGTRPWKGEILDMAILSSSLDGPRIRLLNENGPDSVDAHHGEPHELALDSDKLFEALVRHGTMTLLVWLRTHDSGRTDSAPIVTFSRARSEENFTLGQQARRIVFRLRTSSTGPEVVPFRQTETPEILAANRDVFVAASYDGRVSRIYMNGRLVARSNLAAQTRILPFLADAGLPIAATFVGVLIAAGVLAQGGAVTRRYRCVVGLLAGLLGAGLLIPFGGTGALPDFSIWTLVLGASGGLLVAGAIAPNRDLSHP